MESRVIVSSEDVEEVVERDRIRMKPVFDVWDAVSKGYFADAPKVN